MRRSFLIPARDAQPLYIQQSSPLPGATQGVAYSFQLTANGGTAPYTWSLPTTNGFTIGNLTGLISGVPIAAETDNLSVTVTDAVGTQVTNIFRVTVFSSGSALSFVTTSPLPAAAQGIAYSYQMAATGGAPPYTWSLPATNGFTINSSTGKITGVPLNIETDTLSVTVTDSVSAHVTQGFSVQVVAFAPDSFPGGVVFQDPYSSYQTWYVDPTFGSDAGVHNVAGHIYATIGQALLDVFYAAGLDAGQRRVVVRSSAAWNGGSSTPYLYATPATNGGTGNPPGWYAPSGSVAFGNVPSVNYVLQGDPASNVLPVVDGNYVANTATGPDSHFLCFGSQGGFGKTSNPIAGFTVRKFELPNYSGSIFWMTAGGSGTGRSSYITLEYLNAHDIYYPLSTPSGVSMMSCPDNGKVNNVTIRNCKITNVGLRAPFTYASNDTNVAHYAGNCSAFETYGSSNMTFQNNQFTNCYAGVFYKLSANFPNTCNNWTYIGNVFANGRENVFYSGASGQSIDPASNTVFIGNLFYGRHISFPTDSFAGATVFNGGPHVGSPIGTDIEFIGNTVAEDMTSSFTWEAATGVIVRDNVILSKAGTLNPDPTNVFYGTLGGIVYSQFDYNVYGPGTISWGMSSSGGIAQYQYTSFPQWQQAWTTPRGNYAATKPPQFVNIHDPDGNGRILANLNDFTNPAARDYSIKAGSPLLTASSTGGPVGYDPTNIGPGW